MKKALPIFLLFAQLAFAQHKSLPAKPEPTQEQTGVDKATHVPTKELDVIARFEPGGLEGFVDKIQDKMRLNTDIIPLGKYRVFVAFNVEADGTLGNITINKDPGYGIGPEVLRAIPLLPRWKPAEKDGKPVRSKMGFPFIITIGE